LERFLFCIYTELMSRIARTSVNGGHALSAVAHFGGYEDVLRIYFRQLNVLHALHVGMGTGDGAGGWGAWYPNLRV